MKGSARFIASDDALWLDLTAKRYGKTPSEYLGPKNFTCEWKAFCFDQAIAERGARAENEAASDTGDKSSKSDDFTPTKSATATDGKLQGRISGKVGYEFGGGKLQD